MALKAQIQWEEELEESLEDKPLDHRQITKVSDIWKSW